MTHESGRSRRANSFGDGRGVAGLECYYFFKKGRCVWGNQCKYSHIPTGRAAEEPIRDEFGTTAGHNARRPERVYTRWQGQESPLIYGTTTNTAAASSSRGSQEMPSAAHGDPRNEPAPVSTRRASAGPMGLAIRGLSARDQAGDDSIMLDASSPKATHPVDRVSYLGAIGEPRRSRSPLRSSLPYQRDWRRSTKGTGELGGVSAHENAATRVVSPPPADASPAVVEPSLQIISSAIPASTAGLPAMLDNVMHASESTQRQIDYAVNWIRGAIEVINNLPALADQAVGPATIENAGFRAQLRFEASSAVVALQPLALTVSTWGEEAQTRYQIELRRRRERMAPPINAIISSQRGTMPIAEERQGRSSEPSDKVFL